jgi:hypothetical protein
MGGSSSSLLLVGLEEPRVAGEGDGEEIAAARVLESSRIVVARVSTGSQEQRCERKKVSCRPFPTGELTKSAVREEGLLLAERARLSMSVPIGSWMV